jgi:RNA polymerase sigma-70 factor (ECF subfamily)
MASLDAPDIEILRGIDGGDYAAALSAIARAYRGRVGGFCLGMLGDADEAEDAVQETLIGALDAMPRYRGETSIRVWLLAIARHKCLDRLRRRAVRHTSELSPDAPGRSADPVDVEWVRRGLAALAEGDRAAVVLKYSAGLTFDEIAAALGISLSAAKMRTIRALERLRTRMT